MATALAGKFLQELELLPHHQPHPLLPHDGFLFSVRLAVIVSPFNGIVAGIGLSQLIVYPSLVHDGYVIFDVSDLYAHE